MDNETAHVAFGEAGGIFRPPAFSTSLDFSSRQVRLLIVTVVAAYPILVYLLRFRRVRWLHRKYHYPTRESLSCMTDNEAWEIQKILLQLEFPFIYIKALQFALFRTYGIPTISRLLTSTKQFCDPELSLKRYADTTVFVQEFIGSAPSSTRTIASIARTNFIHSGYRASNKILDDDMLYTLGLFAVQPVRFIEKYEWRGLSDMEKCAIGTFWKSLGDGLEIKYDVLPSGKTGFRDGLHWLEEIMAWSDDYEVRAMLPDIKNHETAAQTINILLYMVPTSLQQIGMHFVSFMMDERLRRAMLYDDPPESYAKVFSVLLSVRRFVMRYLTPPRPNYFRYTTFTDQPDEQGFLSFIRWDAAPYYVKPTIWNRWGPTAWFTWIMGRPLPGDEGSKFHPEGYNIPDVGPSRFLGKGQQFQEKTMEGLRASRTGQCPFH